MTLTWDEWIAIATIAAPLIARALSGIAADASARHNDALARITGMASRSAAEIAVALAALPPRANRAQAKQTLVEDASMMINGQMNDSLKVVGGGGREVAAILSGELAKLTVTATAPVPPLDRISIPPAPLVPRMPA